MLVQDVTAGFSLMDNGSLEGVCVCVNTLTDVCPHSTVCWCMHPQLREVILGSETANVYIYSCLLFTAQLPLMSICHVYSQNLK